MCGYKLATNVQNFTEIYLVRVKYCKKVYFFDSQCIVSVVVKQTYLSISLFVLFDMHNEFNKIACLTVRHKSRKNLLYVSLVFCFYSHFTSSSSCICCLCLSVLLLLLYRLNWIQCNPVWFGLIRWSGQPSLVSSTVWVFRVDSGSSCRWRAPAVERAFSGQLYSALCQSATPRWPTGRQVRRGRLRHVQQHVLAALGRDRLRQRPLAFFTWFQHALPRPSTCMRQSQSVT